MIGTRFHLPDLLPTMPSVGVEVGTDQGAYAAELLKIYPNLLLITVDPWMPYPEIVNPDGTMCDRKLARRKYAENMLPHDGRFIHLEMCSTAAAHHLADEREAGSGFTPPYDFVFIDAGHTYDEVCVDLAAWWPLVKVGGILGGHDFDKPDVSRAVIKFAKTHRCDLQLMNEHGGSDKGKKPGTGMDHIGGWARPSWFWHKEHESQ